MLQFMVLQTTQQQKQYILLNHKHDNNFKKYEMVNNSFTT